ncbi:restriction endonuclease subunit S [Alistipes sp.]|uniref:restriction endonuclease subunit S n=1 Tax=Alistipes sp. TaxID=1872444 RepID=UPI003A8B7E6C
MGNNIPQGYKATALGIIPQEWEVVRFGKVMKCFSGGTPKSSNPDFFGGKIPFIKSGEIHLSTTEQNLSEEGLNQSAAKMVNKGDLLYALYGANSGDCAISKIEGAINQAILCIRTDAFDIPYLLAVLELNRPYYTDVYLQGGQGNLSAEIVKSYMIAVPPLAEQRKIAEVLGVWDEAIEKQARLIEKLALRKRGLMQRLLSAKLRLPGFSEKWEEVKLGDICERVTRKNIEDNQNVMTISAQRGFVAQTDFFNKSVASETLESYYLVFRDEFCYNKSYSNGYPMGAIKRLSEAEKAVVTSLYICFNVKPGTDANIDYLSYYFDNGGLNRGLTKIANEGGRAHGLLNVTPKDFFGLSFEIPSLKEQTAIAEVLTAADREIELAKEKLERLRRQKRGLMQQLLTGKKRVKY